ncbi:unnamed protein product [Linum trigynum]|uniref:Uncharacterized protein n=1 Tax=Linum trigynum TaxID=586398 RepID=A0AAV2E0G3_9ROSI
MFFSCPYWKSCHFFRWVDDESDSDSRVDGLMEENHELKLKLGDMEALEGRVRKVEEKARKRKEEKAAILEDLGKLAELNSAICLELRKMRHTVYGLQKRMNLC